MTRLLEENVDAYVKSLIREAFETGTEFKNNS